MIARTFILDPDGEVIETDIYEHLEWMECNDTALAIDEWGQFDIITEFLGWDHKRIFGTWYPVLFQTIIYKNNQPIDHTYYSDYDDATRGHKELLIKLRAGMLEEWFCWDV